MRLFLVVCVVFLVVNGVYGSITVFWFHRNEHPLCVFEIAVDKTFEIIFVYIIDAGRRFDVNKHFAYLELISLVFWAKYSHTEYTTKTTVFNLLTTS